MRACKVCGILLPFGSLLDLPRHYKAGRICKYCYKTDKNTKAKEMYPDIKINRCKEPDKKECDICNKSFWTAYKKTTTCSEDCLKQKKSNTNREWRINAGLRKRKK